MCLQRNTVLSFFSLTRSTSAKIYMADLLVLSINDIMFLLLGRCMLLFGYINRAVFKNHSRLVWYIFSSVHIQCVSVFTSISPSPTYYRFFTSYALPGWVVCLIFPPLSGVQWYIPKGSPSPPPILIWTLTLASVLSGYEMTLSVGECFGTVLAESV